MMTLKRGDEDGGPKAANAVVQVAAGGDDMKSHYFTENENESQQNVSSVECPTVRDHHKAESTDGNLGLQLTDQFRFQKLLKAVNYACPRRLRPLSIASPDQLDSTSMHQRVMVLLNKLFGNLDV